MFSDAISSTWSRWRPSSRASAAARSGSLCATPAAKKPASLWALTREGLLDDMGGILGRCQSRTRQLLDARHVPAGLERGREEDPQDVLRGLGPEHARAADREHVG